MEAFMVFAERERRCFMAFTESDLSCAGFLAARTEVSEGNVFRLDARTNAECRDCVLLCRPRFVRDALFYLGQQEDADTPRVEELQDEQMTRLRGREQLTLVQTQGSYQLVHLSQTATDIPNEPNRE